MELSTEDDSDKKGSTSVVKQVVHSNKRAMPTAPVHSTSLESDKVSIKSSTTTSSTTITLDAITNAAISQQGLDDNLKDNFEESLSHVSNNNIESQTAVAASIRHSRSVDFFIKGKDIELHADFSLVNTTIIATLQQPPTQPNPTDDSIPGRHSCPGSINRLGRSKAMDHQHNPSQENTENSPAPLTKQGIVEQILGKGTATSEDATFSNDEDDRCRPLDTNPLTSHVPSTRIDTRSLRQRLAKRQKNPDKPDEIMVDPSLVLTMPSTMDLKILITCGDNDDDLAYLDKALMDPSAIPPFDPPPYSPKDTNSCSMVSLTPAAAEAPDEDSKQVEQRLDGEVLSTRSSSRRQHRHKSSSSSSKTEYHTHHHHHHYHHYNDRDKDNESQSIKKERLSHRRKPRGESKDPERRKESSHSSHRHQSSQRHHHHHHHHHSRKKREHEKPANGITKELRKSMFKELPPLPLDIEDEEESGIPLSHKNTLRSMKDRSASKSSKWSSGSVLDLRVTATTQ